MKTSRRKVIKVSLREIWERTKKEYYYYTKRPWTLQEVGKFWDSVIDYDEINKNIYPYFRRFTNSYVLAEKYLPRNDYNMLDIQCRSGNGTLFWYEKKKITKSTCVDFSDNMLKIAKRKLSKLDIEIKFVKITSLPLPFEDKTFDLICCYETIEHIYDYEGFLKELVRVMTDDGIMIITCPNVAWEWVHWISAILGISHSEGPHRFIRRKKLLYNFKRIGLKILEENSTIILPFSNKYLVSVDKFLENIFPEVIKRTICLRRTFILKKV